MSITAYLVSIILVVTHMAIAIWAITSGWYPVLACISGFTAIVLIAMLLEGG